MFPAKKLLDKDRSSWERNPIKGQELWALRTGKRFVSHDYYEDKNGVTSVKVQQGGSEHHPIIEVEINLFWERFTTNYNYLTHAKV